MARSEEALRRRAEKRDRTVEEQRRIDNGQRQQQQTETGPNKKPRNASKYERRSHHDRASSGGRWNIPVADAGTLAVNRDLRQRFLASDGGEGMTSAECARARILLERDQRKREKKTRRNQAKQEASIPAPVHPPSSSSSCSAKEHRDAETAATPDSHEDKQALLQRYSDTDGKGMTPKDRERAKILLARRERREQRRQRERRQRSDVQEATEQNLMDS